MKLESPRMGKSWDDEIQHQSLTELHTATKALVARSHDAMLCTVEATEGEDNW